MKVGEPKKTVVKSKKRDQTLIRQHGRHDESSITREKKIKNVYINYVKI